MSLNQCNTLFSRILQKFHAAMSRFVLAQCAHQLPLHRICLHSILLTLKGKFTRKNESKTHGETKSRLKYRYRAE